VTVISPDAGTDETEWARWLPSRNWPPLDVGAMAGRPVLVLAAHPDDEVLGVGGLVHVLAAAGGELRFLWATDGEASHPGSTSDLVRALPALRRAESRGALTALGAGEAHRLHLGLPDGGLAGREEELADRIGALVRPGDVLLAPWASDGHPDHEAVGRAARSVGGTVLEYPVWTWSWAGPGDPRVPWDRVRRVPLDLTARAAKAAATACFATQVAPIGPGPGDGPVLPDRVLAYFRRDVELVLA
jgi:LmbE family N-acetylglucosaminyl deacetylase